jgi:hypothetical protein
VHEGKVKVWVALPANAKPSELVQPGEAALHDPALGAQPRAVLFATSGDQGLDAASPELAAVLVEVIAPVGEQPIGAPARAAHPAGDRDDAIDQGQELGDVVAVPAGQGDRQRQPTGVGQQVVL